MAKILCIGCSNQICDCCRVLKRICKVLLKNYWHSVFYQCHLLDAFLLLNKKFCLFNKKYGYSVFCQNRTTVTEQ